MNLLQYSIGTTWNNLSNVGLGIELVKAAISVVARCHCRDVVALAMCDMLSSSPCIQSHCCRHLFHAGMGSSSSPCAWRQRRGCHHLFCAGKGSSSLCAWRQCRHCCHLCRTHGDGVIVVIINDVLAWGHLFIMHTETTMSSSSSPWHWPWLWCRHCHLRHGGMELTSSPLSSPWHWPWVL